MIIAMGKVLLGCSCLNDFSTGKDGIFHRKNSQKGNFSSEKFSTGEFYTGAIFQGFRQNTLQIRDSGKI